MWFAFEDRPGASIEALEGSAPPLARWSGRALLDPRFSPATQERRAASVACWSGSYALLDAARVDGPGLESPAELFEADPRSWGVKGWQALDSALAAFSSPVLVRTHAQHVVSDLPSAARLLQTRPQAGVLLDLASMLTTEMAAGPIVIDHLARLLEGAAELARVHGSPRTEPMPGVVARPRVVVLMGQAAAMVEPGADADPGRRSCRPISLDQPGLIDQRALLGVCRDHLKALDETGVGVVLLEPHAREQREALIRP